MSRLEIHPGRKRGGKAVALREKKNEFWAEYRRYCARNNRSEDAAWHFFWREADVPAFGRITNVTSEALDKAIAYMRGEK